MDDSAQELTYSLLVDAYDSVTCGRVEPTHIKAAPQTFRKLVTFLLGLYNDDCLRCWNRYLTSRGIPHSPKNDDPEVDVWAWAPCFNGAWLAVDGDLDEGVIAFVNDNIKYLNDPKFNKRVKICL